ncbi:MAG: hypothetical protein LBH04_02445 [Tannerellaceae bacterium]|nr:hypothetical protein [Tannerellaceae bacterium]
MRKHHIRLLIVALLTVSLASCTGKKNKENAQENAAAQAGLISKAVLTEELKSETVQLLKDMPDSDIPQRIAAGEITIGLANFDYMLPTATAAEATSSLQKARALGVFLADYNLLKVLGQPVEEVEAALTKLASDLDVTFILNNRAGSPTEPLDFRSQQENIINTLAEKDKIDIAVEILGGIIVENACLYANPSLVVKGDVTYAETLSTNMLKRFDIIGEVIDDLATYYPDLKGLRETIAPLGDKLSSVNVARAARADIIDVRNKLLN